MLDNLIAEGEETGVKRNVAPQYYAENTWTEHVSTEEVFEDIETKSTRKLH